MKLQNLYEGVQSVAPNMNDYMKLEPKIVDGFYQIKKNFEQQGIDLYKYAVTHEFIGSTVDTEDVNGYDTTKQEIQTALAGLLLSFQINPYID